MSSAQTFLEQVPEYVDTLGPLGPAYFFVIYVLAEILLLPATPLTLSCGYIFGFPLGVVIALAAGTTAAGISFMLARTVLRPQILKIAEKNDTFQKINCAVEGEGFKIITLLRLSPILPFALSNYAFGLSNVSFFDFIGATFVGCCPGTLAYIYLTGVARTAISGEDVLGQQPWYIYALGVLATVILLKQVTNIAQKAVDDSIVAKGDLEVCESFESGSAMIQRDVGDVG